MKKLIKDWVELIGLATILVLVWQGLELLFFKEIRPSRTDTIIAIPMVFLLHWKYKKYIRDIK